MTVRLAICIPTYNRGPFLDQALASIAAQPEAAEVEVVVSDNASGDDTPQVVERWRARLPRLVYYRWPENAGADRNFLKAVELASAEYCWLFGSDDCVAEGALARVLAVLGEDDILLLDYRLMSVDMRQVLADRRSLTVEAGARFVLHGGDDLRRYLRHATELSGLFAYISTLVFRKSAWMGVPDREEFIGSAWIHVTKLLEAFAKGASLHYPRLTAVLNRSGNDSFLADVGLARRARIDLDYVRVAERVLADAPAMRQAMHDWLRQLLFTWRIVLGLRYRLTAAGDREGLALLEPLLFEPFRDDPSYWPKRLAWRFAPVSLLGAVRRLVRAGG